MGFSVLIEADGEKLGNYPSDGNAVFDFLSGLMMYCDWEVTDKDRDKSLVEVFEWYQRFDALLDSSLCTTCRPLIACMWGDGGDPTEYHEDEFEFYQHRVGQQVTVTEAEFQQMVQSYHKHWQPIEEVMKGILLLLEGFRSHNLEPFSCYEPEYTVPDFEALYSNLEFLSSRDNENVRLTFH